MTAAELRRVRKHLEYVAGNLAELEVLAGAEYFAFQAEDELTAALQIIDIELLRS